jgi:xanthine dehydrogenase YagR molybdenum-binding subunit
MMRFESLRPSELSILGVAPAIANAVLHATWKRVRELPITPDKLL